jgi:signal transduction histidine kinase
VDELRLSVRRLASAAHAERRRLERDLHDGAQQRLVAVRVKLGLVRELAAHDEELTRRFDELEAGLDQAFRDLRALAHRIYPTVLEAEGLAGALRAAGDHYDVPVSVDRGLGRYSSELEAAVYHSCREALENAARHAGDGAKVTVSVAERDGEVVFAVADQGRGFDPAANGRGRGLKNMGDLISALGGRLEIQSTPAGGTTVRGRLPVSA